MRSTILLLMLALGALPAWADIPEKYQGDWLLVNGLVVLHLDADGTMAMQNSTLKGPLTLKADDTFEWNDSKEIQSGRFLEGRLLLKNLPPGSPKWIENLEFRKAGADVAKEVTRFAARQLEEMAAARAKLREKSTRLAMLNNLRQISAAADQYFIENGVKTVKLDQLVGPDKYIKELRVVDGEDYGKLDLSQSVTQLKVVSASGVTASYDR